jgi:nucleoside-diphosphate-sugar epimerase
MTTLVVGATGATGRLLVAQLLDRGQDVRAIVRSAERLPAAVRDHDRLTVTTASILELGPAELFRHLDGCRAVASCLGHNLTLKGVLGRPHRLVSEAVRRLCAAVGARRAAEPTRFVLMSSAGVSDRGERVTPAQRLVISIIRQLVPPHADNEMAAENLRSSAGRSHGAIEWAAVRPDSLIDEDAVSAYEVHPSPRRSALFDPGETSRINVAYFMAELITRDETWGRWRGGMPVIYNARSSRESRSRHA